MREKLNKFRFEFLLFALLMVIFNKIFFPFDFYNKVVWPVNMVLLGVVSAGIFHENRGWLLVLKNVLFAGIIIIPFIASHVFGSPTLAIIGTLTYLGFYLIIFIEVMRQIVRRSEITSSVVFGSLSGFLLLIVIATFSFLLIHTVSGPCFNGIMGESVPDMYQQFTYFSIITTTTIGYGDITPATDNARLLSGFWGVVSQFYMVAVVGIIISKFTSR
jgi:hypothetical protein